MKNLMKKLFVFLTVGLTVMATGCNPTEKEIDDPTEKGIDNPTNPLPESFPRKQLIEQFTGEACGWCPDGMNSIEEAIKGKEDQYVWVSNHAGYYDDEFTIRASKSLASKFKINSAPSMMLNRQKWSYRDSEGNHNEIVLHPGYLSQLTSKVETTSSVSVNITNAFDAAAGKLKVTVSGQSLDTVNTLKLTIIVKESGLHGKQSDFVYSWQGWQDFIHTHVVRLFATNYLGDTLKLDGNDYSAEYEISWNAGWKAENSCVVAFVTNASSNEVLNANESPVVEGTKGGNDITHGGVTPVPVPETYPEYDTVPAKVADLTYETARWGYVGDLNNGNKVIELDLISSMRARYDGNYVNPVSVIYLIVDNVTALPQGTFSFDESGAKGTAWAGFRNDEIFELDGSCFYLAWTSYLTEYDYIYGSQWLLSKGNVTIGENSVDFEATSLIGSTIKGHFEGEFGTIATQNMPQAKLPVRKPSFKK